MQYALWHALAVGTLLLFGVPSNAAVIWIHTRKNSRVAKNKFPLIFAGLDLFVLFTALLLHPINFEAVESGANDFIPFNVCFLFAINGYLMTLLMATVDKFYAVLFPFKYSSKRSTLFNVASLLSTLGNAAVSVAAEAAVVFTDRHGYAFKYGVAVYNTMYILTFLVINILYVMIVAKLINSQRKTRSVAPKDAAG